MTHSMTAFSRTESRDDLGELVWELRSVNHRYLELFVRLPEELRALEPQVRERINKRLGRGKVDCSLRFKPAQGATARIKVNEDLVGQVMEATDQVGQLLHEAVPPSIMDIINWPGVLEMEAQDFTPIQAQASALLDQAIDSLIETRQREGTRLAELIQQRCTAMRKHIERVKELIPLVLDDVKERLRIRLNEISGELDPARLEQEMVILAQRLDVDEEMDRLCTHLDEVERVLQQGKPVGRRLDFLMQELNREANTLTSKSTNAEITQIAVDLKVLIEQMREQVQNIE
ncbi:Protein YicC [hydrothermal vent metagenome]|uniref:Protein YicC n=1 Tax=hydrothermal vent metagenome TaxID=652676 RepID=A0A3B1BD65_9ZZZZ